MNGKYPSLHPEQEVDQFSFGLGNFQDPLETQSIPCIQPSHSLTIKHGDPRPSSNVDILGNYLSPSHIGRPNVTTTTRDQQKHITIAPGMTVRLRGAQETCQCVQDDFFLPSQCLCCNLALCCIMDADYVLCPQCKVVSPLIAEMEGSAKNIACRPDETLDGGVGLGFTLDQLCQLQHEILLRVARSSSTDHHQHSLHPPPPHLPTRAL